MKAVLAYQYGMSNAGDFAITVGALDSLLKKYDEVCVISKYTAQEKEYLSALEYFKNRYNNKVELISGPFSLERGSKIKLLNSYAKGLIQLVSRKTLREYSEKIGAAETVYINGGNILRCNSVTDLIRIMAIFYPARIALHDNIPCVFLPQSTTMIRGVGKEIIKRYLSAARRVFIRESDSYQYFVSSFPRISFTKTIDMAYCIDDKESALEFFKKKYGQNERLKRNPVAITLRKEQIGDIGELDEDIIKVVQKDIIDLIQGQLSADREVLLVVQTRKDLKFTIDICEEINRRKGSLISFVEEYDPVILREIYRRCKCLIGMRLHSLILASSVGTPVVGYFDRTWGRKNPGLLNDINMPFFYVNDKIEWSKAIDNAISSVNKANRYIRIQRDELIRKL